MLYLHFNFNIKNRKRTHVSSVYQYSTSSCQKPDSWIRHLTPHVFLRTRNDGMVPSTHIYYVRMMNSPFLIDTIGVKIIILLLTVRTRTADANDCCHKRFFFCTTYWPTTKNRDLRTILPYVRIYRLYIKDTIILL